MELEMLDRLQMKNIKHSEFASHETYCYEASVYLDGKAFALVSNDGRGGCDSQYSHNNYKGENFYQDLRKLEEEFKSLPKTNPCKYFPEGIEQTFEGWCHEQVMEHLLAKDLKKLLKRCVVAQIKENDELKVVQWNKPKAKPDWLMKEQIKQEFPEVKILNDMDHEDAMSIWRTVG